MRATDNIVLMCFSPPKVRGEISMLISLAEAWVMSGRHNFKLQIFSAGESKVAVDTQIHAFDKRLRALQTSGISTIICANKIDLTDDRYAIAKKESIPLHAGLIYPLPNFSDDINKHIYELCMAFFSDLIMKRQLFHSAGMANFITHGSFGAVSDFPSIIVPGVDQASLTLYQPPASTKATAPPEAKKSEDTYYELYSNPTLVDASKCSISYEDAFAVFIAHNLKCNPGADILILHNDIEADKYQSFTPLLHKYITRHPEIKTIKFTYRKDDGEIVMRKVTRDTGTVTVTIRTFSNKSNTDFIEFMAAAQIAAVNTSGCFDELLQIGRPALMIDNFLLRRKEIMLTILQRERKVGSYDFSTLIRFIELQQALLTADESEKIAIYDSLADCFSEPCVSLLSDQLQQYKTITAAKYNLAEALYKGLSPCKEVAHAVGAGSQSASASAAPVRHRMFTASVPPAGGPDLFEPRRLKRPARLRT
ncbi:MAG: hypothetical protein P1U34_05595 [Coxiellaceae bacterium]|nr:hypothetical protein [Coxiellaceae bacterium]